MSDEYPGNIKAYRGALRALDRANSRILELEAELSAHRWVSVEERLPELNTPVLVVYRGTLCEADYKRNFYWRALRNYDWLDPSDVTHWRPLPAPPDEN